jgi:hypothetical protein
MTMRRIALAVVLVIGTATVALAEDGFRPKAAKRASANASAIQSTPLRPNQDRNVSTSADNLMMNVMDRASSPFACGG